MLDVVRVPAASTTSALAAITRRAIGRRRRASWSARLEATIAAYRGSWSTMPAMGIVRWRNVGEALSPVRTDGLTPRFVRYDTGGHAIDAMWLDPPDAGDRVLLYFHGGGFCFGSFRTHGVLVGALARAMRARAFAPECGRPLPAAGIAISPWVDLSCSGESFRTNDPFDFVGETHCRLAAASYLAGADPRRPDISPLFADLRGLPPLLIQAGAAEVLVDQIRAFANRGREAGVDVTLSAYVDMVHVWHLMRDATPDGQRAIDEAGAFARAHVV